MPFGLVSTVKVHPRASRVLRARSKACRSERGPFSSARVVDFGNVRRSQPGMTVCRPAAVRSITDMLWLQTELYANSVWHTVHHSRTAFRRNPQKSAGSKSSRNIEKRREAANERWNA